MGEASLVSRGMEVQRAFLTLALGQAPGPGVLSRQSELWVGLIKAGPGRLLG